MIIGMQPKEMREVDLCVRADAGLAQLKPKHVHHLRDSDKGAVGTPLYMVRLAPCAKSDQD